MSEPNLFDHSRDALTYATSHQTPERGSIPGPEEYGGSDYDDAPGDTECPRCHHAAHNQGDCIRCTCSHQAAIPGPLMHRDPKPTERKAAAKAKLGRGRLLCRVLAWYRSRGSAGLTPREAARLYVDEIRADGGEVPPNAEYSIRPRIRELAAAGYLCEAGGERDGCGVWMITTKEGDGSEIRITRKKRVPMAERSWEDQRIPPGAIRLERPGVLVRRVSDGELFWLPGEPEPEDHPGHFNRGGVAYTIAAELGAGPGPSAELAAIQGQWLRQSLAEPGAKVTPNAG